MYGQICNRELGGVNKYTKWGCSVGWQSPRMTTDMFLERLETASSDYVKLTKYHCGLPTMCQFSKGSNSHLCVVTDDEGHVLLFDTRHRTDGEEVPRVHQWQAHDNAVFDYAWVNNDRQCLTGSGDSLVALWDVDTMQKISTLEGHKGSVRTVAACPGNPARFASGARDGHIMLWDLRVNKKPNCMNSPEKSILYAHSLAARVNWRKFRRANRAAGPKGVMDNQHSVICVLYQTENVLISAGANDGCVKLWDTRKWYRNSANSMPQPLHTFPYPGNQNNVKGVTTMCLDPWNSQLFVSHTDSRMYRYELSGTYRKPEEYVHTGHRNDTFFMRSATSPDGKYLLSGSGRNTGVIWEVAQPKKRPVFLIGHSEDVSAVDWCPNDICKLATLSDDMSLRIWRPDSRERNTEDPSIFGYAFSAGRGKVCQRQSQVQIVQDEFPFDPPVSSTSPSTSAESQSPGPSHSPTQRGELCMGLDYWSAYYTPRKSPQKLTEEASPLTPTSPLTGRDSSEPALPCSHRKGYRMKERACDDGGSSEELWDKSPQPSTSCDSAEHSHHTPKTLSLITCEAFRSALRDCLVSLSSVATESSPRKQTSNQELRDKSPQPSTSCDSAECSHHPHKTLFSLSSSALRSALRDSRVSLSSVDTESSPRTPRKKTRMKERACGELQDKSPQPSTSCDSAECSPHTPKTSLLFITPHALRDSPLSPSSVDTEPSPRKQTSSCQDPEAPGSRLPSCQSPRQSSRKKGLTRVMSPTKYLLLSPTKTKDMTAHASSSSGSLMPRRLFRLPTASYASSSSGSLMPRQLFSLPTASHASSSSGSLNPRELFSSPTASNASSSSGSLNPRELFSSPTASNASSSSGSLKPRELFSSPTASLPNRVLDPQPKVSTPPPTPLPRKVDWLTQIRLNRLKEAASPNQEACLDVSSSPKASSEESPVSGKKDSNINSTPNQSGSRNRTLKRSLSGVAEQEPEDVTPGKRKKQDQTPTPRSGQKRNSFSKPGSTSQTPQRKSSSETQKTPTTMSIMRYLR